MARRSSRRDGQDHRRRNNNLVSSGKSYSHVVLHCLLSPTLLFAGIFLISISTKIIDSMSMSAVYPVEGADNFSRAENASEAGDVPSAGPTPTPTAASTRIRQHVPWEVERDDAKEASQYESKSHPSTPSVAPEESKPVEAESEEHTKRSRSSKEQGVDDERELGSSRTSRRKRRPYSSIESDSPGKQPASDSKPVSGIMSDNEREKERKKYRDAYMRPKSHSTEPPRPRAESRKSSKPKTIHASELAKPRGAIAGGKVGEFMGSHLEDGSSMVRGQNVTRLSYALYKIVRLFNLKKLIDYPAGAHVEWMPEMVTRFEYDVPGFFYQGLDTTEERLASAKNAGDSYGNADFEVANPEVSIPVDSGDMLLVWNELDGERSDPRSSEYAAYIMNVVKAAKKANIAYITFGQYPRLKGVAPIYSKGRWRFIGKSKEEVRVYPPHEEYETCTEKADWTNFWLFFSSAHSHFCSTSMSEA